MSDNNLSVKEILIQRKSEFEQFLQSIIPEEHQQLVEDIKEKSIEDFMRFVANSVLPFHTNLDIVITVISVQTGMKKEDFSEDDLKKFKDYLSFFCQVVKLIYGISD